MVDDGSGEALRERRVAVQQPVVEGGEDEVEHNLLVGVRGDLAALDGAGQDAPPQLTARLDEAGAVFLGELGIALGPLDERRDDPPVGLAPELAGPGEPAGTA